MKQNQVKKMCSTALLAACCYIGFMYLKINIPVGDMMTAIHFGNTFCVLAALLNGGVSGGLAGAIGMGIADIMDPLYVTSAPKTIFLKFMIGVITGFVAHRIFHLADAHQDKNKSTKIALIASTCGMLFNVIAEPIVSFLYKNYLLGVPYPAAKMFAAFTAATTLFNAITSIIIATILYRFLCKRFYFQKEKA